jgi:hypothetical protein
MLQITEIARHMLDELDFGYLEVVKVPASDGRGGYIRVPVSVNAEWYSRFCRKFLVSRRHYPKPRTIIRRCHTRRALERIASGRIDGVYVGRLLDFISWYYDE